VLNGDRQISRGTEIKGDTVSFPKVQGFNLVVAATNEHGEPDFLPAGEPAVLEIPGLVESAVYWTVQGGHSIQNSGSAPSQHVAIASANGSSFSVNRFPANSAGKMDLGTFDGSIGATGHDGDPAMHATDTIDYEIILSGKVDVELPGGKVRTLAPGDLLVMNGVPHAWKNSYEEDCVYVAITIGYHQ
jgi:hypothetical protein